MKKLLVAVFVLSGAWAQAQQVVDLGKDDKVISMAPMAMNTKINCKSKDGSISIAGYVPNDTYNGELTVSVNGSEIIMSQSLENRLITGYAIQAVTDVRNGVLTVSARTSDLNKSYASLELSAFPKSMKGKYSHGSFAVSFKADFLFKDEKDISNAKLDCESSYRF